MGNGIILRVLENTDLSPEVSRTLKKLLPGSTVKYFKDKPNYRSSIELRINTLYEAFLFILEAYPPNPKFTSVDVETLQAYVLECKNACDLTKSNFSELHKELEKFTGCVVDVLAKEWDWSESDTDAEKEAIACLNEAEQFMLMKQGRPDIATLAPLETSSGKVVYVLQYDKTLSSVYPLFAKEIEEIRKYKYPKTPKWFNELNEEYKQTYFANLKLNPINPTTIRRDLNQLLLNWKTAKGTSLNLSDDLNRIKNNTSPIPKWFETYNPGQKELFRFLVIDSTSAKEIDSRIEGFKKQISELASNKQFEATAGLLPKLPLWYWTLPHKQQCFLEYVLKTSESLEDAFAFVPSRLRTLPVLANYGAHSLYIIGQDGQLLSKEGKDSPLYSPRYRSSHISSRDVLKLPQSVQQRHVESNIDKLMENVADKQYLLLQTLISPILAFDYVPHAVWDYLPEPPPDLELFRTARSAVAQHKRSADVLQHNHPFNIAKRYYYTPSNDRDSLALIEKAKPLAAKIPGLDALLEDYKSVLESPIGTATFWDYDGRELFLSSLEELITLTMNGISYGSCVSGKDRKAIELIHTDAMILYREIYGVWPKFGDPKEKRERIQLVDLVRFLYRTRHQQVLAGQNAPGSEGTKTPDWYLPEDMAGAINTQLNDKDGLKKDDRIATDNEVRNISKYLSSYYTKKNELHSLLIAKQLGEKTCTTLYDSLSALINEESQFKTKGSSWAVGFYDQDKSSTTPTGIKKIANLMGDEKSGSNNVHRMSKIFEIVMDRPEEDQSRSKATISVYDGVRRLLSPVEKGGDLDEIASTVVAEWNSLFDNSKRERNLASMI